MAAVGERNYGFKVKVAPSIGEVQKLGTIVAMETGVEPSHEADSMPAEKPTGKEVNTPETTRPPESDHIVSLHPSGSGGKEDEQGARGDKPLHYSSSEEQYIIQETVLFGWNSWELSTQGKKTLDGIIEKIGNNEDVVIAAQLEGHSDSIGTTKNNMKVSRLRAGSVKKYLVEKGIELDKIATTGFGEERPVESDKIKEGRQKNRRVEIVVISEKSNLQRQTLPLTANK